MFVHFTEMFCVVIFQVGGVNERLIVSLFAGVIKVSVCVHVLYCSSRRPGVSETICCNLGLFYMFQPVGPGLH